MYNIGEMRTDVRQRLLYHLKRNVAHKVIWFVLFLALSGLMVKGVQAQEMQEPVLVTFLGMSFEKLRGGIKAKGDQQKWYDKVVLILTDPLGTLNRHTDRLFGIKSSVRLKSFRSAPRQYEGINLTHMKSVKFVKEDTESISPVGVEVRFIW